MLSTRYWLPRARTLKKSMPNARACKTTIDCSHLFALQRIA